MTEAERIENDVKEYMVKQGMHDRPDITEHDFRQGYAAGMKAENERLQQLIKEKDDIEDARKRYYEDKLESMQISLNNQYDELKSAQELNRELVEGLGLIRKLISIRSLAIADNKIESLINKSK